MGSLQTISTIIPSFRSKDLLEISIQSMEKFCPSNLKLNHIIVENSNDTSYKNDILRLSKNIIWINNDTSAIGSEANAEAIIVGLKSVADEMVFMFHCDVCVTSDVFFELMIKKHEEGNVMVGTLFDKNIDRINAIHISGLLVETKIAKSVNYMPCRKSDKYMDVGDELTEYCRLKNLRHFCFENTYNDRACSSSNKYDNFNVDKCLDDNGDVMFMHLGRGIPKTQNKYTNEKRVLLNGWTKFCRENIL